MFHRWHGWHLSVLEYKRVLSYRHKQDHLSWLCVAKCPVLFTGKGTEIHFYLCLWETLSWLWLEMVLRRGRVLEYNSWTVHVLKQISWPLEGYWPLRISSWCDVFWVVALDLGISSWASQLELRADAAILKAYHPSHCHKLQSSPCFIISFPCS